MQNLTDGNPFQVLLKFTLPIIAGNIFQLFYTLADSMIVGQTLGKEALAAVGATSIIIYLILCFIQGITGGFGIRLGQLFGAGNQKQLQKAATLSWILSISIAVILTLLGCLLSHPILYWMKIPENVYQMSYAYMFVVLVGAGATVFYNIISNMLRALGDSRTPLIFLMFSSVLNIALDFLFIVPMQLGIAGAAWATVLSQLVSAVLCTIVGIRHFPILRLRFHDCKDPVNELKALLRIGFPMGFQMSVMCIGQLAMQTAVNALGSDAIAGYTAATKVDQVSVLINSAFGIAISNFVAQNYGANLKSRIVQGVRASLLQAELTNAVLCCAILLLRSYVPALFVNQPTETVIAYSSGYLVAVAPFYFLLGLLLVIRSSVQSMGNSAAPFGACIIELIMRIGGTCILPAFIGYTGICLSTPLAWLGACGLLLPVYLYKIKKITQ